MNSLDDRRIASWLALLTFATYAYFFAGGGWNQNAQFDLTRAMVERHTFVIDAYATNSGDVSIAGGHVYVNKAPGLSWLAAIPYAALYLLKTSRLDVNSALVLTFNAYICTVICVALPGALVPAMLYRVARRRGFDSRWSATVAMATALATQLLPYATLFMVAVPSGALMLFALTSERRMLAGFAAGLAATMNYLCLPAIAILALTWDASSDRSGMETRLRTRPTLRFLLGALPPVLALASYQYVCFGSPFTSSVARTDPRFLTPNAAFGVLGRPSLEALIGITVSPYRGLFYFAPLLVMAIVGLVLWRDGRERMRMAIVLISLFFFAFNVCFNGWEGGFGIGARYLVPLIPLWGLALLQARPRAAVVALATISFAINFSAAAVDPQPSATIPRPLTQYIAPLLLHGEFSNRVPITPPWSARLLTGHTSVNRMGLDEFKIFDLHPTGSPEAEWASFNLGEPFFGAGDPRSLIPIVLVIAAGAAAVVVRSRRVPRS